MKKHYWLLVFLGVLALILVACNVIEYTAPTLNVPSGGFQTSDGELTLTGTSLPGYEVRAVVDKWVAGKTLVSDDGTWSVDITITEPGEHVLIVQLLNNGFAVGQARPVTVTMGGVAAPQAAQAAPAAVEAVPPTMNMPGGAGLEAGDLALTGTGEPGSEVQVVVDGQVVDGTQVGDDGNWSLEISLTEPGEHEFTVQTIDASEAVVAKAKPVSVSLAPIVLEVVAPDLLFPADGADVLTGQLTLIGSGGPGTEVEIVDGSVVLGTAQVGADGEWLFTFEPLEGDHQFAGRSAVDKTATSSVVEVRVSSDKDSIDCDSNLGIDRGDTFIVGTCDTLRDISQLLDISLEDLEAANSELEDPNLIYPGQFITIP